MNYRGPEQICEDKIYSSQDAESEDAKTWEFIKLLFMDDAPLHFRAALGFAPEAEKKMQSQAVENDVDAHSFFDSIGKDDSKSSGNDRHESHKKSDEEVDEAIKSSLLVGDYSSAVSKCFSASRFADALLISALGGPELWSSSQERYVKNHPKSFIKNLIYGVVNHNFTGLIQDSNLEQWKETLSFIITYTGGEEFVSLANALSQRLLREGFKFPAVICALAASNIDLAMSIWMSDSEDQVGAVRLHHGIEKLYVLAQAMRKHGKGDSAMTTQYFSEYAGLLASQGNLKDAVRFLDLASSGYVTGQESVATQGELANRIKVALEGPSTSAVASQHPRSGRGGAARAAQPRALPGGPQRAPAAAAAVVSAGPQRTLPTGPQRVSAPGPQRLRGASGPRGAPSPARGAIRGAPPRNLAAAPDSRGAPAPAPTSETAAAAAPPPIARGRRVPGPIRRSVPRASVPVLNRPGTPMPTEPVAEPERPIAPVSAPGRNIPPQAAANMAGIRSPIARGRRVPGPIRRSVPRASVPVLNRPGTPMPTEPVAEPERPIAPVSAPGRNIPPQAAANMAGIRPRIARPGLPVRRVTPRAADPFAASQTTPAPHRPTGPPQRDPAVQPSAVQPARVLPAPTPMPTHTPAPTPVRESLPTRAAVQLNRSGPSFVQPVAPQPQAPAVDRSVSAPRAASIAPAARVGVPRGAFPRRGAQAGQPRVIQPASQPTIQPAAAPHESDQFPGTIPARQPARVPAASGRLPTISNAAPPRRLLRGFAPASAQVPPPVPVVETQEVHSSFPSAESSFEHQPFSADESFGDASSQAGIVDDVPQDPVQDVDASQVSNGESGYDDAHFTEHSSYDEPSSSQHQWEEISSATEDMKETPISHPEPSAPAPEPVSSQPNATVDHPIEDVSLGDNGDAPRSPTPFPEFSGVETPEGINSSPLDRHSFVPAPARAARPVARGPRARAGPGIRRGPAVRPSGAVSHESSSPSLSLNESVSSTYPDLASNLKKVLDFYGSQKFSAIDERMYQDTIKRVASLQTQMQSGELSEATLKSLNELLDAISRGEVQSATKIHVDMIQNSWNEARSWLPGFKNLIGLMKKYPMS
eukprot:TRINITY_DN6266_c1_g1_i1.p1 TRINITY_DN6266_c1_g1~~TRINITY_DN6266_c1_g1_i1.p1  ORF type:complete len:1204 (+),score=307.61 TRINITY_DN6266_c1_g1_i1:318-3614(+)